MCVETSHKISIYITKIVTLYSLFTMALSTPVILLCAVLVAVACALLYCCFSKPTAPTVHHTPHEAYADYQQMMAQENNEQDEEGPTDADAESHDHAHKEHYGGAPPVAQRTEPSAAEPLGQNEAPLSLEAGTTSNTTGAVPKDCFPKDQLAPQDLLPTDTNSTWAQVNPAGQGNIGDNNLLTAGHHVGINTVGQTLRNANLQLRSEPPNPQMKVSPWMQSTIEPDSNRRPMEIS